MVLMFHSVQCRCEEGDSYFVDSVDELGPHSLCRCALARQVITTALQQEHTHMYSHILLTAPKQYEYASMHPTQTLNNQYILTTSWLILLTLSNSVCIKAVRQSDFFWWKKKNKENH